VAEDVGGSAQPCGLQVFLLLSYLHTRTGKLPARLDLTDLNAEVIGGFLQHLENVRGNTVASRNTRLAAFHSLFRYASLQAPQHANLISRVLAFQTKRTTNTKARHRVCTGARLQPPGQSRHRYPPRRPGRRRLAQACMAACLGRGRAKGQRFTPGR
jgi:hypothetical protein